MKKSLCALMIFAGIGPALAADSAPTRDAVLATMKSASTFMVDKVAVEGGYVWLVSDDLRRRWGEIPARPSQIWLQGGTERMGQVFLDAWLATRDDYYLKASRRAADAVV